MATNDIDIDIVTLVEMAFDEIAGGPGTVEFFKDVQDRYAREAQRTGNSPDAFLCQMNERALRMAGAI